MVKGYYNIIDGNYWIKNEDGLTVGIGATKEEAIEDAEFWGVDCSNITFEEEI